MDLLINDKPLLLQRELAVEVGLNEALLLQQLHISSLDSQSRRDGHKWVCRTYEEWKNEVFPFWSVATINRIIRRLENKGILISTDSYNGMKMDRTKWYRIDYPVLGSSLSQ